MNEIKDYLSQHNLYYFQKYDFVNDLNEIINYNGSIKITGVMIQKLFNNEVFCGFISSTNCDNLVYNKVFDVNPTRCVLYIKYSEKNKSCNISDIIKKIKEEYSNVIMLTSLINDKKMKNNIIIKIFFSSDIK